MADDESRHSPKTFKASQDLKLKIVPICLHVLWCKRPRESRFLGGGGFSSGVSTDYGLLARATRVRRSPLQLVPVSGQPC